MVSAGVSKFFEPRWKFWGHVIELVLILIAIIMTGVFMNLAPFYGRGDIMVIAMVSQPIPHELHQRSLTLCHSRAPNPSSSSSTRS